MSITSAVEFKSALGALGLSSTQHTAALTVFNWFVFTLGKGQQGSAKWVLVNARNSDIEFAANTFAHQQGWI